MNSDLVSAYGAVLVGSITAMASVILGLRKRINQEELPEARRVIAEQQQRITQLERDLAAARQDVLAGDRRIYDLEREAAQHGRPIRRSPPPGGDSDG